MELNYKQTLDLVENFMEETQIRKFCTEICGGRCCGICYESKNACHKTEGRRLSCSAFICSSLQRVLEPNSGEWVSYYNSSFDKSYNRAFMAISSTMYYVQEGDSVYNIYFVPFIKHKQKKFRIESSYLGFFSHPYYRDVCKRNITCIPTHMMNDFK